MKSTLETIREMEKEYSRNVSSAKMDIYPSIRTLLESFGEEVIGHDLKVPPHTHITAMEVMAENRQKASQRLKVKEIISQISK